MLPNGQFTGVSNVDAIAFVPTTQIMTGKSLNVSDGNAVGEGDDDDDDMMDGGNYDGDDDGDDVEDSTTGTEGMKTQGKVNAMLLKRLEKLLLNSEKPFNHTIGDVLSIFEDNCGSVEIEQHSQRLTFRIDCTEFVCSCQECLP